MPDVWSPSKPCSVTSQWRYQIIGLLFDDKDVHKGANNLFRVMTESHDRESDVQPVEQQNFLC